MPKIPRRLLRRACERPRLCRWRRSCCWPSSSARLAGTTLRRPRPSRPVRPAPPALRHRSGSPAASRSRYPKSCAASTYRGRRPRRPPPRAPAASPAIKDSTIRTASRDGPARLRRLPRRQPSGRRLKTRPTSGRGFPKPGEPRPTRSGRTRCLNHESPGVHPLRQSRRPADRPLQLRHTTATPTRCCKSARA